MGVFVVDAEVLARARFGTSQLAETVGALGILTAPQPLPWHAGWRRRHTASFRRRLADEPVAAAVLASAFSQHWTADFLTVPPERPGLALDDELAGVEALDDDHVRADLEQVRTPLPAVVRSASGLGAGVADLLRWVFAETIAPTWPRRERVLRADVVARTSRLARDGWSGVLDDMRPGMRWLGTNADGRAELAVNAHPNPPRDIRGSTLTFTAAHCARGWVTWRLEEPARYGIVYPVSGIFAGGPSPTPASLENLLGPRRARLLVAAREPVSTSALVAQTGWPLGSVGGHLAVLARAGLLERRRSGREVLYWWSATAHDLVVSATP